MVFYLHQGNFKEMLLEFINSSMGVQVSFKNVDVVLDSDKVRKGK